MNILKQWQRWVPLLLFISCFVTKASSVLGKTISFLAMIDMQSEVWSDSPDCNLFKKNINCPFPSGFIYQAFLILQPHLHYVQYHIWWWHMAQMLALEFNKWPVKVTSELEIWYSCIYQPCTEYSMQSTTIYWSRYPKLIAILFSISSEEHALCNNPQLQLWLLSMSYRAECLIFSFRFIQCCNKSLCSQFSL